MPRYSSVSTTIPVGVPYLADPEKGVENTANETSVPTAIERKPNFWFDRHHGIFLTYQVAELKRDAVRAWMRIALTVGVLFLYLGLWHYCEVCILGVTVVSCAASCTLCNFLSFNCVAGVLASLWKGFRIGTELANVEIHWKI